MTTALRRGTADFEDASDSRPPGAATAVGLVVGLRLFGLAVFAVAAGGLHAMHARLTRWDANWYARVAADGYGHTRLHPDGRLLGDEAFFPLYPLLERAGRTVTGLAYEDAGLLVSGVSIVAAAWGIFAVGASLAGSRAGVWLAGTWAALPTAIVLTLAYSEALFVALAAWGLHAVLRGRWLLAAGLAVLAGLTRPIGLAVAAAVIVGAVVELWQGRGSERPVGEVVRPLVAAVVAPLGWLGYVGWVGWRHHDPLAYFAVQDGWGNGFDGGRTFAVWIADHVSDLSHPAAVAAGLGMLAGLAVLVGLLVFSARDRQPLAVLAYSAILLIFALTTSRYFGSKPRYLLPAFPLLLPVALRLAAWRPRHRAVKPVLLAPLVVACSVGGAVTLLGSGPP